MRQGNINLRKYQPQKASRMYILKVLVYTIVIVGLVWFIAAKLEEKAQRVEELRIERIEIEN